MSEHPFISSALGGRSTVPYPNAATDCQLLSTTADDAQQLQLIIQVVAERRKCYSVKQCVYNVDISQRKIYWE